MNEIEELELKIAKFLRYGILVAGLLIFIGWAINFEWSGNPFARFQVYSHAQMSDLVEVSFMAQDWGILISYVGLFALISLPIIRVLLTAVLFVKQKEYTLAMIAVFVLSGLITSFALGIEL